MAMREINHAYFVSIRRELCLIEEHAWWADQVLAQLQLYITDLRFLERFSVWVAEKDYEDSVISKRLGCVWREEGKELTLLLSQVRGGYITDWNVLASHLKHKIQDSKPLIEEWCKGMLSWSLTSESPRSDEILHILLDAIVNNLKDLVSYKACKDVPVNDQIETLEGKLVFLQNFLKLNTKCIYNNDFKELKNRIHFFANNEACQSFLCWVKGAAETDLMLSNMLLRIKPCMPDVMASYFPTLKYNASTSDDIVRYIDVILNSLKHLVAYKGAIIVPLKLHIETLEQKLVFLQNFLKLAANCINSEEFQKFMISVHDFSENAASLTVHYWLKQGDEQIEYEMNRMLSDMLQKIEPCTPDVTALYFGTLKAMKLQQSDTHLLGQTIVSFVDLLHKNLETCTLKDSLQNLWEDLVFVLTFLAHPPMENADDDELTLFLGQIDVLLKEYCYLIFPLDKRDASIEIKVQYFQQEIGTLNDRIRRVYCKFQDSSIYDFPKIIGGGFLDFLIRNLRNLKEKMISDTTTCVTFAKKAIETIHEELVSLRPIFNDMLELQNDHQELSDTWLQVISLAYSNEHVVNSCFVLDFPIWYHMAYLDDVLNRIKVVKTKFEKIKECSVYNVGVLPCSGSILSKQAGASNSNQVVVGFEEEASTIIETLIGGYKPLDIVSIVGMPGLGKTTLTRKVYGAPSLRGHFHIFAFCSVSRDQNAKRLLLNILSTIIGMEDDCGMTEHDLAHKLKQCLSGRRYLIVMDDMWEISVWNNIKSSFPDDQNGSRVVFTTRFNKVALEAQINCIPYHLGFFPDDKGWELLQKKVFSDGSCPQKFFDVGKLIAKNCKGLPLSVVVIAGVLAKTEPSLNWWCEIAKRIGSYLSIEKGCMDLLEFTYKHLPEYLKPLLLYFGAFPKGTLISARSLILLWIDEGFVHESKTLSLQEVAKDYLDDLVDRSLIIVTDTSSNSGVKAVSIHDLIHDFCQIKAKDENIFRVLPFSAGSTSIPPSEEEDEEDDIAFPSIFSAEEKEDKDDDAFTSIPSEELDGCLDILKSRFKSLNRIVGIGFHYSIHQFKLQVKKFSQLRRGNASSTSLSHLIYYYRDENASSSSSSHPIYNYRVFLQMDGKTIGDVIPTFPHVRSLLSFDKSNDRFDIVSIIGKLKLVQVLHLDNMWLEENDLEHICLLFHLRHIVALVDHLSVPSCISNLWALETFILRKMSKGDILLPETIWEMKWLRHVNITRCRLTFPRGQQHEHEAYFKLNHVESFSSPILSTGKNLQDLLQRLPAVRKLSCHFDISCNSVNKQVETLDFLNQIESLNLAYIGDRSPYVIKFPSTLKKLKLVGFKLPWKAISDIGKLQNLLVLKLLWNSFEGERCDMEDVVFRSLKYLKLNGLNLVQWDAVPDSFPCLEQLFVIGCENLVEIPPCFGVILTLKRFEVHVCRKATNSAFDIKEEQMDWGNDTLEVKIT